MREIEIPTWLARLCLWASLEKGLGHKYVRRIPTGNPAKPYRYLYSLTGGTGEVNHQEFVRGAAFKVAGGHLHVESVDGDQVTVRHDESGKTHTMARHELAQLLGDHHAEEIQRHQQSHAKRELRARERISTRRSKLPATSARIADALEDAAGHDFGSVDVEDQRIQDGLKARLPRREMKRIKTFRDAVAALVRSAGKPRTWEDLLDAKIGGSGGTETVLDVLRGLGREIDDRKLANIAPPAAAIAEMHRTAEEQHWADQEEEDEETTDSHDLTDEERERAAAAGAFDFDFSKGLELPEFLGRILWAQELLKGAGHKYLRRVPTGNPRRPWRYYYRVTGGRHLGHDLEIVEGAAFRIKDEDKEGHFHVLKVEGDKVTVRHDESGREATMSRQALRSMLHREHAEAIATERERVQRNAEEAKEFGSERQRNKTAEAARKLEEHFFPQPKEVAKPKPRIAASRELKPKKEPKPAQDQPAEDGLEKLGRTGDHIWGSRKDLAQLGRIDSSKQLENMSSDDAAVIIRKSKLISAQTLDEMRADGKSPGVAHMTLALLASIKEKPDNTANARSQYLDRIREIEGSLTRVKTLKDMHELIVELNNARLGSERVVGTYLQAHEAEAEAHRLNEEADKNGEGRPYRVKYDYSTYRSTVWRRSSSNFQALGDGFINFLRQRSKLYKDAYTTAMTVDGEWSYRNQPKLTPEQGWAYLEASTKGGKRKVAEKKGEAIKVESFIKAGETSRGHSEAKAKKQIERKGGVQIKDANPERARTTFGLREIDPGEYLSQADREYHFVELEQAFHDLADALEIPAELVGFRGRVGVGLGARGRGGNAVAHYEPGRKAINITKVRGAGSVAHEWGHAFDNIIAEHYIPMGGHRSEPFMTLESDDARIPDDVRAAVKGVMSAISDHPDPTKARAEYTALRAKANQQVDNLINRNNNLVNEANEIFRTPKKEQIASRIETAKLNIKNYENQLQLAQQAASAATSAKQKSQAQERVEAIQHGIMGFEQKIDDLQRSEGRTEAQDKRYAEIKDEIERLRPAINAAKREAKKVLDLKIELASDLKRNSMAAGAYYAKPEELFARSFETYVHEKLKAQDRTNSYLVGHDKLDQGVYPQGEERKRIVAAMDKLFEAIRRGKHLEKALDSLDSEILPTGHLHQELPDWLGELLHGQELQKGAGHKYLRRVPTGNPRRPWRYYYRVTGGKQLGHADEFVVGAAFRVKDASQEGHFHVTAVDGDQVEIRHDESGRSVRISKDALAQMLHQEHAEAIETEHQRLRQQLTDVAEYGSEKQRQRLRGRARKFATGFGRELNDEIEATERPAPTAATAQGAGAGGADAGSERRGPGVSAADGPPEAGGAKITPPTLAQAVTEEPPALQSEVLPTAAPTTKSPAIQQHDDLLPDPTVRLPDEVRRFSHPRGMLTELFSHQVEGAERILSAWAEGDGIVLQDEAGLGKTNTALAALKAHGGKRNLIVVPTAGKAGLIRQWQDSAQLFGIDLQRGAQAEGYGVVSYEELYDRIEATDPRTGRQQVEYQLKPEFEGTFDSVVFDESHSMQNPQAASAHAGKNLQDRTSKVLYLSATPYTNLVDMHYLTKLGLFGSKWDSFKEWAGFAGAQIEEGSNDIKNPSSPLPMAAVAATLHVDGKALRRVTSLEGVTSRFVQMPRRALDPGAHETFATARQIFTEAVDNAVVADSISKAFATAWARQFWETRKIDQAIELGKQALAEGRQVAFYTSYKSANHAHLRALANIALRKASRLAEQDREREAARYEQWAQSVIERVNALPEVPSAVKRLTEAFGGPKVVAEIHGDTRKKPEVEQAAYQAGEKKVVVATMARGGTGISLHDTVGNAPRTQINLSLPWSGREFLQVAGRSHRLGSKSNTEMHWVVGEDQVEQHNAAMVARRLRNMGALTSGDPDATVDAATLAAWSVAENHPDDDDPETLLKVLERAEQDPEQIPEGDENQQARDYFREFAEARKAGRNVLEERHTERLASQAARARLEARRAAEQLRQKQGDRYFTFHWDDEAQRVHVDSPAHYVKHAKLFNKVAGARKSSHPAAGWGWSIPYARMPLLAEGFAAETIKVDMREVAARAKAEAETAEKARLEQKAIDDADGLALHREPLLKKGLHISRAPASRPGWFLLSGNTYAHKDRIRAAGGRWNQPWGAQQWAIDTAGLAQLSGAKAEPKPEPTPPPALPGKAHQEAQDAAYAARDRADSTEDPAEKARHLQEAAGHYEAAAKHADEQTRRRHEQDAKMMRSMAALYGQQSQISKSLGRSL